MKWLPAPLVPGRYMRADAQGHAGILIVTENDIKYGKLNKHRWSGERYFGPIPYDPKARIGSLFFESKEVKTCQK